MKKIVVKVLRLASTVIVILLPFWPVTENFFPPDAQVDNQFFFTYLLLGLAIVLSGTGLMYFLKRSGSTAGWLFFSIGMIALFPLHLGPPREDALLLTFSAIEKFRYGMLMIAVWLLFFASLKITTGLKTAAVKLLIVFFSVTAVLNIWDNFSSFMFDYQMQQWVNAGHRADEFFKKVNYHEAWRAAARTCLYLLAVCIAFLLLRKSKIRRWQFFLIAGFSLAGIAFCLLFLFNGPGYYFPFMVPAIALAPAYWIGVILLVNKNKNAL